MGQGLGDAFDNACIVQEMKKWLNESDAGILCQSNPESYYCKTPVAFGSERLWVGPWSRAVDGKQSGSSGCGGDYAKCSGFNNH
jgi:hypothetical protein